MFFTKCITISEAFIKGGGIVNSFLSFLSSLFFSPEENNSNSNDSSIQNELDEAARSVNGMPDVGETSDLLSEMDDKENFNIQGDGLRDNSAGYGRESGTAGYPNPFDKGTQ